MDAVEFLKEKNRMCNSFDNCCKDRESKTFFCEIHTELNETRETCAEYCKNHPEETVAIVEKWSKNHPKKTRQSEFLKMFPDADIAEDGYLRINPCYLSQGRCPKNADFNCCVKCREQFWNEVIE